VLASFRRGEVSVTAATEALALGRSRFYELYADYLDAAAHQRQQTWTPGSSGGDHAPDWPAGVNRVC